MMAQDVAQTGRRLINIFIKLCCLWLEIFYIFVTGRATGTFPIKFPNSVVQLSAVGIYQLADILQGVSLVRIYWLLAFRVPSTGRN